MDWTAERIAEVRQKAGPDGPLFWTLGGQSVLSLLDALEEAQRERDAISADYEVLRRETEAEIVALRNGTYEDTDF